MEYSLDFSDRLIDAAKSFFGKEHAEDETGRLVLYLSLLSCEITLKALLENAGFTPEELKKRSHNLCRLQEDLCFCDIEDKTVPGSRKHSAAELLAEVVDPSFANTTVGTLLSAEELGSSRYPNEIRYGDLPTHYPPLTMLLCAEIVSQWARANFQGIMKSERIQNRQESKK